MPLNENATCEQYIEPALEVAGWEFERQLRIGPGRVNIIGDGMYDESQEIVADYLLRYGGVPLGIVEAKAESFLRKAFAGEL